MTAVLSKSPYDAGQIIWLVVVMVGIFALSWLATKFLSKRLPGSSKTNHMKIVEKLSMGKDRQVLLVKVGEEHFMVGVAGQQISFSQPVKLDATVPPTYAEVQEKVNNDQKDETTED